MNLRELCELLWTLEPPDPDFWEDLEEIKANQPPMPADPWDSDRSQIGTVTTIC